MFNKLLPTMSNSNREEEHSPPPVVPSERALMHNPENPRAVTFYNFEPAKLLHYSCQLLEHNPIQIVQDNRRGTVDWSFLPATAGNNNDIASSAKDSSFEEVLAQSRTFCMNGVDFRNDIFRQKGLEQVQTFFAKGGTVVMVGGNCQELNQLFGCQWSYTGRGNYTVQDFECVPTPAAHHYLGCDAHGRPRYPLQIDIKDAMLIEVPSPKEALYLPRPYKNKRSFMEAEVVLEEEWYKDETGEVDEDAFYEIHPNNHEYLGKIRKREQQWDDYVPPTATPMAIHKEGHGTLIWIGDALDQDTNMRSLLALLLTTDLHNNKANSSTKRTCYDAPKGKYKFAV